MSNKLIHFNTINYLFVYILIAVFSSSCDDSSIDTKLESNNVESDYKYISITFTSNNQTRKMKLINQVISTSGNSHYLNLKFDDGSYCKIETKIALDVSQSYNLTLNNSLLGLPDNYARVEFYDITNQMTYYSIFQNDALFINPQFYNSLYLILNIKELNLGLYFSSDVVAKINGTLAILK